MRNRLFDILTLSVVLFLLGLTACSMEPDGPLSDPPAPSVEAASDAPNAATSPAATTDPARLPPPGPTDEVRAFNITSGMWEPALLMDVKADGEFQHAGRLFRLRGKAGLIQWINDVDVDQLPLADATFDPNAEHKVPNLDDVVYVTTQKNRRHVLFAQVLGGETVTFAGQAFLTTKPGSAVKTGVVESWSEAGPNIVSLTGATQTHRIDDNTTLRTVDGVVVSVDTTDRAKYLPLIGSKYVVGSIHETDVTPQLWRSLALELKQPDGATASINMLRPLWWIQQTGAAEGKSISLEVTEAGLAGDARVLSLTNDVKVDSRDESSRGAIVIGTIRHENAKVLSLVFDGDESTPLGVTPNHPLFSADRDAYVPAGELRIGENIKTEGGKLAVLSSVREREKSVPVYNLEVHRAQSYFVGPQRLLAHNTGINCFDLVRKVNNIPKEGRLTTNVGEVFKGLAKDNGIDPRLASERLHAIKKDAGRGGADNVIFDRTGNVFSPETGELLGSLTTGGAKRVP